MTEEDIGHGVSIDYVSWCPDRELNPQYDGTPDIARYGLLITHPTPDGSDMCVGFVTFDRPATRMITPDTPMWTVESESPLTLSPSVLCRLCGHHGFIREGRWVPA